MRTPTGAVFKRHPEADASASSPQSESPGRRLPENADAAIVLGTGLFALLIFGLAHDALADDSYITLSYARNLAEHGQWGMVEGVPSNSATSPLNVLVIGGTAAALGIVGGVHTIVALGVVNTALAMWLAHSWCRIARLLALPRSTAVVGTGLVLLNPVLLSSIGLEPLLWAAIVTALLVTALTGRPLLFGVLSGALALARLDLVIFSVVLALAVPAIRGRLPLAGAVAAAPVIAYGTWSWLHFGSAIPDTFVIKTVQEKFGYELFGQMRLFDFRNGPILLVAQHATAGILLIVLTVPAALVLGAALVGRVLRWPWADRFGPVTAFGAAGALHVAVYALIGVPPYIWYYAPGLVGLSAMLAVGLGLLVRDCPGPVSQRHAAGALGIGLVVLLAIGGLTGRGVPWDRPPMFANWALPEQYRVVAADLGAMVGEDAVIAPGEIGALAFYCDCTIVDHFSDRGRVAPLVRDRIDDARPVEKWLLERNYERFDLDRAGIGARYQLAWGPGHVTPAPGRWNVSSPTLGDGHFGLYEIPGWPITGDAPRG